MNAFFFRASPNHVVSIHNDIPKNLSDGFLWLDFVRDEVTRAPEQWQQQILNVTGILIDEFHLADVLNVQHPSSFDLTDDYQILIFCKLMTTVQDDKDRLLNDTHLSPTQLHTTPVSFIITEHTVITVRETDSPVFDIQLQKLKNITLTQPHADAPAKNKGMPTSSTDLCLKLLNAMIDKYLEVRAPLTAQIEHWQTALLQEKKRFTEWAQLLRESVALQKLENLCEEQIDALQEFRDAFIDNQFDTDASSHSQPQRRDLMLVRLNDLIEHANRVQKHASRLESALKAAVDLHFSASSNQTNETMRFLAILTAIFAPLTLLTGVYGMNFDAIPGLHNPRGFWFLLMAMVMVTLSLLYYFHRHRIVNRSEKSIAQLLSGEMDV
ncbi:MAG: corA 1 [Burkholderiaceae bacterium]|nr:corA 1 [Burkholderiaceae bacterium]